MSYAADWMVVTGFILAVLGVVLRVVMMMRSSDAHPANVAVAGRDLLRSHSTTFPKSPIPIVMWISLSAGLVLLIAGVLLEFR